MLDDEERSVLQETERALARNDPDLVRLMREGPRPRRWVPVAVVAVTLAVVVGLMWLGLLGEALLVALVVAGLLAMWGVWPLSGRARMRRDGGRAGRGRGR